MPKRYYWIKLSQNFFGLKEIKVLKKMENGSDYILFWQELLLASLDYTDETQKTGLLSFKENIPWSQELMEDVFGYSREIITGAMTMFKNLGMITVTESGEMWANDIERLIGKESDSAERVRKHRAKIKLLEDNNVTCNVTSNVTSNVTENKKCNVEKEKDIETYKEEDKEKIEDIKIEYSEKVFLTEKQFNILIYDYGKIITISAIEILSNYKCSKNKKYESDYHALLTWAIKEAGGKDRQLIKAEVAKRRSDNEAQKKVMNEIKEGKLEKRMSPAELSELTKGITEKSNFLNGGAKQQEEPPWGVKE